MNDGMKKDRGNGVAQTDIASMTPEELKTLLSGMGEKPFRADQIFDWIHGKLAVSFDEMTNLSAGLRRRLSDECKITAPVLVRRQISKKDGTNKFLFALEDGQMVESVLMPYHHGLSICISSQVGCRMGCTFCASTIGGLVRQMRPSEMLGQIYAIERITKERASSIVVMGTGEPLDNLDNLLTFIRLLCHPGGHHMSQRNITVSTCGIVPAIRRLAKEDLQITLALSLHGATQEKRQHLMPVAKAYPLPEVMEACEYYFERTGRRMTYEYSLVAGVNDLRSDARQLCALLRGRNCHLNLIPVNPVRESGYARPDRRGVLRFKNSLEKCGINVTIRREMGSDIDGACGQLRRRYEAEGVEE